MAATLAQKQVTRRVALDLPADLVEAVERRSVGLDVIVELSLRRWVAHFDRMGDMLAAMDASAETLRPLTEPEVGDVISAMNERERDAASR